LARSGTKNHHNSLIKKKQQQQQQQFRGRYSPIGLDLGSNQIKIVQLQNNRGAVATRLKVTTTTPHGSIVDGQIVKKEVLIAKLKLVRTKLNIHGKKVNTALSPSVCSMRLVKLPPLTAKEIRKAMNWEVEKHFSLSPSEAIYDYCPARLNPVAVNGQTDYILAAVSRGIVPKSLPKLCQAAFMPCANMGWPPQAFMVAECKNEVESMNKTHNITLLFTLKLPIFSPYCPLYKNTIIKRRLQTDILFS